MANRRTVERHTPLLVRPSLPALVLPLAQVRDQDQDLVQALVQAPGRAPALAQARAQGAGRLSMASAEAKDGQVSNEAVNYFIFPANLFSRFSRPDHVRVWNL